MLTTLVLQLENKPGVLNRVASLFRHRGFNIESLSVGHTHELGVSRMTIVVDTNEDGALRLEANLHKLVDVIRVENLTGTAPVFRDLDNQSGEHTTNTRRIDAIGSGVPGTDFGYRIRLSGIREYWRRRERQQSNRSVIRGYGILETARPGVSLCREELDRRLVQGRDLAGSIHAEVRYMPKPPILSLTTRCINIPGRVPFVIRRTLHSGRSRNRKKDR